MKDVYLIKRIIYMLDEDDVFENVKNPKEDPPTLFDPTNFDLMAALVFARSRVEIVGITTSDNKAKNIIRKLADGDKNTEFTNNNGIIRCTATTLTYVPEEDRDDIDDTIMFVHMYQAVKVPIDKAFDNDCLSKVNFENFHMLAEVLYDADVEEEYIEDDEDDKPDLTTLDFGAFFNNENKNIPS